MAAPRMSRIVRLVLSALTAVVILATAAAPFVSPGSEARGKERHGHGHRQEQVQRQSKERGTAKARKQQVESASKKRSKRNTRKGNRIGNPSAGANPSHSASNPNLPSADDAAIPPTLEESAPGLPDGYNTLYRTRTFQLSPDCAIGEKNMFCPRVLEQTFAQPTPVQVEVIAPAPCGNALISVVTRDEATGYFYSLAAVQSFQGGSTGVLDLGTVKNYYIDYSDFDYDDCGPVSMTIHEMTPNRNAILNP
jgi:hypothetical protein